jgi:hypothetical protein
MNTQPRFADGVQLTGFPVSVAWSALLKLKPTAPPPARLIADSTPTSDDPDGGPEHGAVGTVAFEHWL